MPWHDPDFGCKLISFLLRDDPPFRGAGGQKLNTTHAEGTLNFISHKTCIFDFHKTIMKLYNKSEYTNSSNLNIPEGNIIADTLLQIFKSVSYTHLPSPRDRQKSRMPS